MRDGATFELNKGTQINNAPINASVVGLSSKPITEAKEWIRIRVNSSTKPTKVEFFDDTTQVINGTPQSSLLASQLKNYRGYEQYIPRKDLSVAPNRDRIQGRLLLFKIVHNLEEEFRVVDTVVQYKTLV